MKLKTNLTQLLSGVLSPLFFSLLLFPLAASGQAVENCTNGLDDDGDGLIDCFDTDCTCTGQCADFYYSTCNPDCYYLPPCGPVSLATKWVSNAETGTYSPLVAGDLDGDGIPEVVTTQVEQRDLYILDGATGLIKVHVVNPNTIWPGGTAPAIADLDNDGFGEIVIVGDDRKLYCYEHTGAVKYVSTSLVGYAARYKFAVPNIADFDQNGWPEVNIGNQVFNGQTGALLASGGNFLSDGEHPARVAIGYSFASTVAVDVFPTSACLGCQGLEIVAGNQVLSVNLTNGLVLPVATLPGGYTDGFTSVADFDKDGDLDAIVQGQKSGKNTVYVWDLQTSTLMHSYTLLNNWSEGASRVNVADLDGDGDLDVSFVGHPWIYALDNNFNPLWINPIVDPSSITCTSVFDFCGDGSSEVVYRSEEKLQILDGATGNVNWEDVCLSFTHIENPLVLDVDNDGKTEILIECGSNGSKFSGNVVAYEAVGTPNIKTRPVWNQHGYFNTNINDDLSVPRYQQMQHIVGDKLQLNTFMNQYFNPTFPSPDATLKILGSPICLQDSIELSVEICNVGDNVFPANTPISGYTGNPQLTAAPWLGIVANAPAISQGQCDTLYFKIPRIANDSIYLVLNDDHSTAPPYNFIADFPVTNIGECRFNNNIGVLYLPYQPHSVSLGQDTTICDQSVLSLDAAGQDLIKWIWSDGSTGSSFTAQGPGIYAVTVTDVCNITQTDSLIVGLNTSTTVQIGPDLSVCPGDTAYLSVPGYDSYTWNSAAILSCNNCPNISLAPTGPTAVILEAAYSFGCSARDTVMVSLYPTFNKTIDTTICFGTQVVWNGQNILPDSSRLFSLQTYHGCDSMVLVRVHGTGVGTYNITVDTSVCFGSTLLINNTVLAPGDEKTFYLSTFTGCDSTVLVRVHGTGVGTYNVTVDTSVCFGSTLLINNTVLAPGDEKTFYLSTFTGCDSTVLVRVHGTGLGTYNITIDTSVCLGSSLSVNNTVILPNDEMTFHLSSITGCDSTVLVRVAPRDTFHVLESRSICFGESSDVFGTPQNIAGNYTGHFTASNGCDSTQVVQLFVFPQIQLQVDGTPACFGESNASLSANVVNGVGPIQFHWNASPDNTPTLNNLPAGNYALTVTDGNQCTESKTLTIGERPPAIFSTTVDSVLCFGQSNGSIHVQTSDPTLLFQFNGGGFAQKVDFPNLSAGAYELVSQDVFDCQDTVAITVSQPPALTVQLPADTTIFWGASLPLNIEIGGQGGLAWNWSDTSYLSCLTCPNPVLQTPLQTTRYVLTIMDENGCEASDDLIVRVEQIIGVYIPNAMGGDGDNANLVLGFNPAVRKVNLFRIYDRWGDLLHEAQNVLPGDSALSWDGRFRGKLVNPGVYLWQIELELVDGSVLKKLGDLTVIR